LTNNPYPKALADNDDMSLYSPFVVLGLYVEAFFCFYWLQKFWPVKVEASRNASIDGLRGFLAFGVFVHHASIWFVFLKTGVWDVPESRLFAHLGQTTVTLFFMITGYLFFGRLLAQQETPIDWFRLYRSRVLRIVPLYLVVMGLTIAMIALIKHTHWLPPTGELWAKKSLLGLITAGVTWTLAYEWKFYFALPLLGLLMGIRPAWRWIGFAVLMLALTKAHLAWDIHAFAFVGGIAAALLTRHTGFQKMAAHPLASVWVVAAVALVITGFDTAYAVLPTVLLGTAFCLIANGANVWGLLSTPLTRAFGEITYSIYLLHGPLLFIVFRFVIGLDEAATFSPVVHWSSLAILIPVLLGLSLASFRLLELPIIRRGS
jgi:peptidoglycan/LPS O-acetylase OafA/YrhL